MGLISSPEMQSFYDLILKKQFMEGNSERQLYNKLYDGNSNWTMTRASRKIEKNEIRESIDGNSLSIVGFAHFQ